MNKNLYVKIQTWISNYASDGTRVEATAAGGKRCDYTGVFEVIYKSTKTVVDASDFVIEVHTVAWHLTSVDI